MKNIWGRALAFGLIAVFCAACGSSNDDNAVMESFFSSLKREPVHLETFHTKAQARQSVFEYIEIFYNRQRRHSSLNHKTPLEYYCEATQAL